MAYETSYKIIWEDDEPTHDEFLDALAPIMEAVELKGIDHDAIREITENIISGDLVKWYTYVSDVASISTQWPEVVFIVDCTGEDGESWCTFIRGGLYYSRDYTPPVFNEDDFSELAKLP